jgi:hypothetical protein
MGELSKHFEREIKLNGFVTITAGENTASSHIVFKPYILGKKSKKFRRLSIYSNQWPCGIKSTLTMTTTSHHISSNPLQHASSTSTEV